MIITGTVVLTGSISPGDTTDQFPVTDPQYGLGSKREVDSIATRDAIYTLRRDFGMLVTVTADSTPANNGTYMLCNVALGGVDNVLSNNANWKAFASGSGGGIADITYSALSALKAVGTLSKGQWYNITDRGVILFATDINNIGLSGYYQAYNADYQNVGVYTGVFAATGITPIGTNEGVWHTGISHAVGNIVIWGGSNWINNNGLIGSATNDTTLSTDWTKLNIAITPTTQGYIFEVDAIDYDFDDSSSSNVFISRRDKRGNVLTSDSFVDPFSTFQWGNTFVSNNVVSNDSNLNCLNQTGSIVYNTISEASLVDATNSSGDIEENNVSNQSVISATTNTGNISQNALTSVSVIIASSNSGEVTGNNLSNSSQIDVSGQLSSGTVNDNTVSNNSNIAAGNNNADCSNNIVTSNSTIGVANQISGVVNGNLLSSGATLSGNNNTVDIISNNISNNSTLDGANNSGTISANNISGQSSLIATNNTSSIMKNTISSNGEIDASSNTNTIDGNAVSGNASISATNNSQQVLYNTVSAESILDVSAAGSTGSFTNNNITNGASASIINNSGAINGCNLFNLSTPTFDNNSSNIQYCNFYGDSQDTLTNNSGTIQYCNFKGSSLETANLDSNSGGISSCDFSSSSAILIGNVGGISNCTFSSNCSPDLSNNLGQIVSNNFSLNCTSSLASNGVAGTINNCNFSQDDVADLSNNVGTIDGCNFFSSTGNLSNNSGLFPSGGIFYCIFNTSSSDLSSNSGLFERCIFSNNATRNLSSNTVTVSDISFVGNTIIGGIDIVPLGASGAIEINKTETSIVQTTTTTMAISMADGLVSQTKKIICSAHGTGHDITITPSHLCGFTTIKFTAIGQAIVLEFIPANTLGAAACWSIISNQGATLT